MNYLFHNKQEKAFSLLEVIVAIFIITIGIIGAVNLISYSISSAAVAKSKIIATELAQEGMELVRNIRDSNWLADATWSSGLDTCSSGCRVQYNSPSLITFVNTPLQLNSNGFYGYNGIAGFIAFKDTFFYRKITITSVSAYEIKVVSEVAWSERGKSYNVNAEDRLYNWK